jgi:hypothetical protein
LCGEPVTLHDRTSYGPTGSNVFEVTIATFINERPTTAGNVLFQHRAAIP